MKKREANYLDTKKRTNPLIVLGVIAGIILVFGIIHYATNYTKLEENRHKTIEDVIEAMNKTSTEETSSSTSGESGTETEETNTETE